MKKEREALRTAWTKMLDFGGTRSIGTLGDVLFEAELEDMCEEEPSTWDAIAEREFWEDNQPPWRNVRQRDQVAYCMLLAYMLSIHLPFHYLRVIPDTPALGWLLLAAFAAGSWKAKPLVVMQCSGMCRRAAVTLIVAHTVANIW